MGEAKRRQLAVQTQALEAMAVDTPGGRIHVQWDHGASATPNAQLTFFAEFLATTGVYDSWVNCCPLSYTSLNAHSKRDVLGTRLLAILAGHNRYAHITGLRGDAVSPQILGMEKIISEDALRRSLSRMSAEQSQAWLVPQLMGSVQAALSTPGSWISTPPSNLCTANKAGLRSATTRTSPVAPATPCIPIGSAICAWCWTLLSHQAKSTAPPRRVLA